MLKKNFLFDISYSRRKNMFNKRVWLVVSLFAVLALLLTACGGQAPTESAEVTAAATDAATAAPTEAATAVVTAPTELQFCVLLAVGIDQGWDLSFVESFDRVVAAQPIAGLTINEMKVVEGLWGGADAEAAMRSFIEDGGCDIIWPHGGYNDDVDNLKADYPDTMFVEVGSGVLSTGDNDYHFWLRCHEPSYAMGVLAGHLSETNIFGGIGTFPASDVNDSLNSFFDGAASVQGEIIRKVFFVNDWYDPTAANEAAKAQIAAGAEHIDMYAETFDACAEGGVLCYGAYTDYSEYYPDTAISSFIAKWDTAIQWAAQEWVKAKSGAGFDAPESPIFSMSSDGSCDVKLSDSLISTIPAEALDAFNQTRDAILDGSLEVQWDDSEPVSD
jgi:basic membrane protein A